MSCKAERHCAPFLACIFVVCLTLGCTTGQAPESTVGCCAASHGAEQRNPAPGDECLAVWCPPPRDEGGGDAGAYEEVEVTAQVFGARGEYTSPSFLTAAPPGSALRAENVMVDVPGEYTTARGFERLPAALPLGARIKAWTTYQGALIAHDGTKLHRYDASGGTWTTYPGTYLAPSPGEYSEEEVPGGGDKPGKITFFTTQQALYFTTTDGVYRLEGLTQAPTPAGVPQALIGTATPSRAGQALPASSVTAYRYVWGRRATNGRIHLGAPSGRVEVENRSEAFTFAPTTGVARSANVVTVEVSPTVAAKLLPGQVVNLTATGDGAYPTGNFIILTVGSSSFTYSQAGANGAAGSPGTFSFTSVATAVDVRHVIPIPDGLDASHFLQVYRSDAVPLGGTPSDEQFLVHEKPFSELATKFGVSSMFRTANVVTVDFFGRPHGRAVGSSVELLNEFGIPADASNFPPGIKTVATVPSFSTFTYSEAGPNANLAGSAKFKWLPDYVFVDSTPDSLKADALYTNANSGGGIGSAQFGPPMAATSAIFKDRAFYGNVELSERLALTALSVEEGGLSVGSEFIISNGPEAELYSGGTTENAPAGVFKVFTDGTPSQNITRTVSSLVRAINARPSGLAQARQLSTNASTPGQFQIESRSTTSPPLTVQARQSSPFIVPALRYEVSAVTMDRVGNIVTVDTSEPHGFTVGQTVFRTDNDPSLSDAAWPDGQFTVASVPNPTRLTFNEVRANASTGPGYFLKSGGEDVQTDDEAAPGGWMVSPVANPDAVQATLPEIAGDRYKALMRFLVLGDSLFMLKEDGLFRLTGSGPESFVVQHVDSTIRFIATDMAVAVGSTAYALTTEGLVSWTEDSRPRPASVPVEDKFRSIVETARLSVDQNAFAVAHESKRRVWFFLPSGPSDTASTRALVYNTLTDTWVTRLKAAGAALVHPESDRLYIAPPTNPVTGLAPAPARERNSGTGADYQEEDGTAVQAQVTWTPNVGPGGNVEFQDVWSSFHFQQPVPTSISVGFATNYVPTPVFFSLSSSDSQAPGTISTPPTIEHSRGTHHTLTIRHGQVGVPMRLLGYSMKQRYYQSRGP